jgi:HK97 family phage major capsid protein
MTDEIKKLVEDVNKAAAEIKTELDNVKGDASKKGAEFDVKFGKMVDSMTEASDKLKAIEAKQTALEAALARSDMSGKKSEDEIITKSRETLNKFLREGKDALDGTNFKFDKSNGIEIRAMQTNVNVDGGYLVVPELADFMVTRAFETSPMRPISRVVTTGSNSIQVVVDDAEAGARWVGEGASSGETSTPQIGRLEITAHKIEAEPFMTTEMTQDPFVDVEAWLREKVADKFARTENSSFVTGDGVAKPQGFLTLPAWAVAGTYERNKLEQINLGNASALTADGLIDLQGSLKEIYQAGAVFLMKRNAYAKALQLKGADGYYFGQTIIKDGQTQLQLLGKPVIFADDMPAIASNALSVAYGNFGVGYTIVDRVGLNVLVDPYTAKGFVKYYSTKRVGGAVTNYEAIKIGKIAV